MSERLEVVGLTHQQSASAVNQADIAGGDNLPAADMEVSLAGNDCWIDYKPPRPNKLRTCLQATG